MGLYDKFHRRTNQKCPREKYSQKSKKDIDTLIFA